MLFKGIVSQDAGFYFQLYKFKTVILKMLINFAEFPERQYCTVTKQFGKAASTHINGFLETDGNFMKKLWEKLSSPAALRDLKGEYR